MSTQRAISAKRYNATCLKEIGIYKEGKTYDVYVHSIFSTRPFTEEEREEFKEAFKKDLPKDALNFIREDRKTIFNYSPVGDAGYTVFETEEGLKSYFKLVASKK